MTPCIYSAINHEEIIIFDCTLFEIFDSWNNTFKENLYFISLTGKWGMRFR